MMEYLIEEESKEETRSDEEVLAASLEDPALFVHLVRKYEAPFLRRAERILHSPEDAEEVVQEAFTKIYLYAPRFKKQEGATFSSWGYTILTNTALTRYSKRKKEGSLRAPLDPEVYESLPDTVDTAEQSLLADEIASVLTRMPETFARALTRHFIDDVPHERAAAEEGVSEGAIKTRVHRAKKEFRKLLGEVTN